MIQIVSESEAHGNWQMPGKYTFWADYEPPAISAKEQNELHSAGMDFPMVSLKTESLRFTRVP
jgi:hypothetical protein